MKLRPLLSPSLTHSPAETSVCALILFIPSHLFNSGEDKYRRLCGMKEFVSHFSLSVFDFLFYFEVLPSYAAFHFLFLCDFLPFFLVFTCLLLVNQPLCVCCVYIVCLLPDVFVCSSFLSPRVCPMSSCIEFLFFLTFFLISNFAPLGFVLLLCTSWFFGCNHFLDLSSLLKDFLIVLLSVPHRLTV